MPGRTSWVLKWLGHSSGQPVLCNFRSYIHSLTPPGIQYLFCLDVVIKGNPIACQFLDCQPHCVLSFSFSAGFGSDMTCHLPQPFWFFFAHFQTAKWIKSAAVLKHALGPGFTSMVPNGFVFCTWMTTHVYVLVHIHAWFWVYVFFLFFLPFFSSRSTVSTQSQRLWDYQSPFVFRREPSWLGGGLRWEPSGLYSKQFPLRLPCPLHIVTKAIYFKGRRNSNFMCVCVKL